MRATALPAAKRWRMTALTVSRPVADRIPQPSRVELVGAVELKGVAHPLQVWRLSS
jgi:class 3 adenylate cyclase